MRLSVSDLIDIFIQAPLGALDFNTYLNYFESRSTYKY